MTGLVESLAYGPGGDTLAVGGDGFIRLLDARTNEQLAETLVDGLVTRLIFSRDGSRLVVATGESVPDSISIRDPATLAPIGAPIEPEDLPARIEPSSGGPRSRVDARRQLGRHRLERGRARLVGRPEPFRDQTS